MDSRWAGEILRHIRTLAGKEQADAAAATGVGRAAVSHWESGRTLPNISQLSTLARLYGIPLETLLDEMGIAGATVSITLRDWYQHRAADTSSIPVATESKSQHKKMRPGGRRKVRGADVSPDHHDDEDTLALYGKTSEQTFGLRLRPVKTGRGSH